MLIKDSGAGNNIVEQVVESSLQKIGVYCYNTALITDMMLENCTLTVMRVKKGGGAVPILYPTNLQHLLEIAACNQGHYKHLLLTGLSLFGTIDISNFGTLLLGDDYLTVTLTHTNGANFGVKLYAIEGTDYTDSAIQYSPNTALADTPKTINVVDCYQLALPVANLQKATLTYGDGRTATYTPDELICVTTDMNDIVNIMSNGTIWITTSGYLNLFCLNIAEVVTATIHYTTQTKFYAISNK